jgi:hypothetical protein
MTSRPSPSGLLIDWSRLTLSFEANFEAQILTITAITWKSYRYLVVVSLLFVTILG